MKSVRRSNITQPTEGYSYEAVVAALSGTVEALSREIAQTIKTLSQEGK